MEPHNELESGKMLGCWEVWHAVTIISMEVRQHAMEMKGVAFSMMKWALDESMFSRKISPLPVIAVASSPRCKHSWASLHAKHAVNWFKFKNTVKYNLIHWRNKYSSFPRWRYVLTLSKSSDHLYKFIYLYNYHNSFLLLLMFNFILYIIIIIRYVKLW
jgi:hypothetical protein